MDHSALIEHCCLVLDGFDARSMALDHYINAYFTINQIESDDEQQFITEVFAGCVRYSCVLKVMTDGFFARLGKTVLVSEGSLYTVLAYLILFRIEELGVTEFSSFVKSLDAPKMYKFLSFVLDEKHLITWMKDVWLKHYDPGFVHQRLLHPVLKNLPELQKLIKYLRMKVDNAGTTKRKSVKQTTDPKPFNITQPKPKSIPMPEPIPKLRKHRPVPDTTYNKPQEEESLSQQKEINRRKAERRLMESTQRQFTCASGQKSERAQQRLRELMEEQDDKLLFQKHKANPIPSHINSEIPIKLNTAAILREGKLYKKKEEDNIKHFERLEAGATDPSDFLERQTQMRQKDLDEQFAAIERRRIEGRLSHEEAILARKNLIKNNRAKVDAIKEDTKKMFQEYLEAKFVKEQEMRQLVERVMDGHANSHEARRKLTDYKAKLVREVREESRELMRVALEDAEIEMRKKMEIINEIRAMDAVPAVRFKMVDFTNTGGYGLLSEMSIAELRERLSLLREAELRAEDERRDEIQAGKQAKEQLLMETLETIAKYRTEESRAAAQRLEDKKMTHNSRKIAKNDSLNDLQRKYEERKAERLKEQELAKIKISKKSTQRTSALNNEKKTQEEKRWEELERSKEQMSKLASKGFYGNQSASRLKAQNRTTLLST